MGNDYTMVKDKYGHTLCYLDVATGAIQSKHKGLVTETTLMPGKKIQFVRNNVRTIIHRKFNDEYEIRSSDVEK